MQPCPVAELDNHLIADCSGHSADFAWARQNVWQGLDRVADVQSIGQLL
jgi:hypothetical protein